MAPSLVSAYLLLSSLVPVVISSPVLQLQKPVVAAAQNVEAEKYDLTPSAHYAFAGITTFLKLPSQSCLTSSGPSPDILVVGLPFDTATSYRSGTRFGPNAIRQGSRAASLCGPYNYRQAINPFKQNVSIVDCGDFPISPFDNGLAFAQMEEWYGRLLDREVENSEFSIASRITGKVHPKVIALGGDHSISLPILRALHKVYGPLSAIHIDAHIDTWDPKVFAGANGTPSKQSQYADGTPYYWAGIEGLLSKTSVHAGIRSSLDSENDIAIDERTGFTIIPASDMLEEGGLQKVIKNIRASVPHDEPIYVSLDIDVLDPAFAPGTAGPAAGGWSTREIIQIVIDGLAGMNVVGVDVVEVLPSLDSAEITAVAAAELVFELITRLVRNGLKK